MLLRCMRAENRKLHASPIWVLFFLLPVISAAYGTVNYLGNLGILSASWYSLWTQHTLFYSLFFFPAMVAIYASYLWRLEHLGHNWNLIMSAPVRPFALFLAKFIVVVKLVLLTQLFIFFLYCFCGKVFAGLPGWPPLETLGFLLRGVLGGLSVVALQLILSMLIRSFAIPIFVSLFGGIIGMLATSKGSGLYWPYALMQYGMNSNKSTDVLSGNYLSFCLSCIVWLLALFLIVNMLLTRRDVKS